MFCFSRSAVKLKCSSIFILIMTSIFCLYKGGNVGLHKVRKDGLVVTVCPVKMLMPTCVAYGQSLVTYCTNFCIKVFHTESLKQIQ